MPPPASPPPESPPPASPPPPSAARAVADRYVEAVNERDLAALAGLFSGEAVLTHTLGIFNGTEAITAFYRDVIFAAGPTVTITEVAEATADRCVMALDGRVGDYVSRTVDVFSVNGSGLITRLDIRLSS